MQGKRTTAADYLGQPVNFGGIIVPLHQAITEMRAEGHPEQIIERWVQGQLHSRTR